MKAICAANAVARERLGHVNVVILTPGSFAARTACSMVILLQGIRIAR